MRRVYAAVLVLLAVSILVPSFSVEAAWSGGTIVIREDGSVEPGDAPARRDGDVYVLTADVNIVSSTSGYAGGIFVLRDNVVVDGGNHLLRGAATGSHSSNPGISVGNRVGVKVRNIRIQDFMYGIHIYDSSGIEVAESVLKSNGHGIHISDSSNNRIVMNIIEDNTFGIAIYGSRASNNEVAGNIVENNENCGISISGRDNSIYLNIFINNGPRGTQQVSPSPSANLWDDGLRGNYWSDYDGSDADGDGIGDTSYVINSKNIDRYPLMSRSRYFFVNASTSIGAVTGSGWYREDSTATVSIASTIVDKDFLNNYVFEGWMVDGEIVSASPDYSFVVNKPVTLVAGWRTEVKLVAIGLIVGVILITVVMLVVLITRRKRAPSPPPPPPPPPV